MVSHLCKHPTGWGSIASGRFLNFAERGLLVSLAMASIEIGKTNKKILASIRKRTRCRHLVAIWCHCDALAWCYLILPGLSLERSRFEMEGLVMNMFTCCRSLYLNCNLAVIRLWRKIINQLTQNGNKHVVVEHHLKPQWSPSEEPVKPQWSPSEAPVKPEWSSSEAPVKNQWRTSDAPVKNQ